MKFPNLNKYPYFAIDTETTGIKWWDPNFRVISFAISTPDGKDWFYDLRQDAKAAEWAKAEFPRVTVPWAAHNAKFEAHGTRAMGAPLPVSLGQCTIVRAALCNEHMGGYDLDTLGEVILGEGKVDIVGELAALLGGPATKNHQMARLNLAPTSLLSKYNKRDANLCRRLFEHQRREIEAQDLNLVWGLEQELLEVIVDLECRGVAVDVEAAERVSREFQRLIKRGLIELKKMAGFEVNPNPSALLTKFINPRRIANGTWVCGLDGTPLDTTAGGKPSITADALRRIKHPAGDLILRLRKWDKTDGTFIRGHILGNHHEGVIHANFNQTKFDNQRGTVTGRLSVNSPALQQIHKRDKDIAEQVRSLFIPDPGQVWSCRDWSQMDFRVFAHYLSDERITRQYQDNPDLDFHQMVADMTRLPRTASRAGEANAKQINLGLVFGMGKGKLAMEMGLPYTIQERRGRPQIIPGEEAEAIFKQYHSNVPGVKNLLDRAGSIAKSRGFVRTIMGRHLRFPRGESTHKAGGLIFQGSAADALKVKLVEVHRMLKSTDGRMVLNVHDEINSTLPKKDAKRLHDGIGQLMEKFDGEGTPIHFKVPIRSEGNLGKNWWEASK